MREWQIAGERGNQILSYLSYNYIQCHSSCRDFNLQNLIVHYYITATASQIAGNDHISKPVSIHLLQFFSSHLPPELLPASPWRGESINSTTIAGQKTSIKSSNMPNIQVDVSNHTKQVAVQLLVIIYLRLHVYCLKIIIQVRSSLPSFSSFQLFKRMTFPEGNQLWI